MTLVGYAVLVGVPVICTAWVELSASPKSRSAAWAEQIVGPNVAVSLLAAGFGYSAVFIMRAAAAILGLLVYGGMHN
jgi:hypothetical protein